MENFELLRKHQDYIAGCSSCNILSFRKIPPKEIFWEIGPIIVELNRRHACICELHAQNIHITHGLCPECIAHSASADNIRRKQRSQGFFDCFGSASMNGHCDQIGCKYRKLCVREEYDYPTKMEHLSFLFQKAEDQKIFASA